MGRAVHLSRCVGTVHCAGGRWEHRGLQVRMCGQRQLSGTHDGQWNILLRGCAESCLLSNYLWILIIGMHT